MASNAARRAGVALLGIATLALASAPAGAVTQSAPGTAAPQRAAPRALEPGTTATYRNPRFGFQLTYPADRFEPGGNPANPDGRLWLSRDGRARILAGSFRNDDATSLADYRREVIERSYPGASLDYAPVKADWFVVSGVRDGTMFYERVTFTCGGRIINGWLMLYPAAERRIYDRVVEQIARSYKPGQGAQGDCR